MNHVDDPTPKPFLEETTANHLQHERLHGNNRSERWQARYIRRVNNLEKLPPNMLSRRIRVLAWTLCIGAGVYGILYSEPSQSVGMHEKRLSEMVKSERGLDAQPADPFAEPPVHALSSIRHKLFAIWYDYWEYTPEEIAEIKARAAYDRRKKYYEAQKQLDEMHGIKTRNVDFDDLHSKLEMVVRATRDEDAAEPRQQQQQQPAQSIRPTQPSSNDRK